jgi:hypothetical protein
MRIAVPLGEVKMDFKKVTKGLARGTTVATVDGKASKDTVWSSGDLTPGNGASKEAGKGNNGNANAGAGLIASANSASNAGGNGNALGQAKDKEKEKVKKEKKVK